MKVVDFYELDKPAGSLAWDGSRWLVSEDFLYRILARPLHVPEEITTANPDAFLDNLHRQYRSAYFRASLPVERETLKPADPPRPP
jgi:hypothetical protein